MAPRRLLNSITHVVSSLMWQQGTRWVERLSGTRREPRPQTLLSHTCNIEPGWLSRYRDGLQAGRPGFGMRVFSTPQRPDRLWNPTKSPIQWTLWVLS
jgi:hypothetical protein